MIDFLSVIHILNPNIVTIRGEDAFDAEGNSVVYDQAAVDAYIQAHAYIGLRQSEYPSFADQFDLLYHGGMDAWKASIDAVKTKYPKE